MDERKRQSNAALCGECEVAGGLGEWQPEFRQRASLWPVAQGQTAAMLVGYLMGETEPQTAALALVRSWQGVEALEDARQGVVGNAGAAVGDLKTVALLLLAAAQGDLPAGEKSMALSSRLPMACSTSSGSHFCFGALASSATNST